MKTREDLYNILGKLPTKRGAVSYREIYKKNMGDYNLIKYELQLNQNEAVPAFLTIPKNVKAPYKAVLFNHSHGGMYDMGKNELINSCPYMWNVPYANDLAKIGVAALTIDHIGFGERHILDEVSTYKKLILNGEYMWGVMVYDSIRAVDFLHTLDFIDTKNIGTIGMSMGSTMAWWLSALDERIKYCVDICCLTDYDEFFNVNADYKGHGIYYFIPNLINEFKTAEINALIAPRPHLSVAGIKDTLTPVKGLDKIERELKLVYESCGKPDGFKLLRYDCAHVELEEMRGEIINFISGM